MSCQRQVMSSTRIPPAVGPYSQAVRWGNLLFCSGVVPVDPATGQLVEADIEVQARRILENIKMLLEDSGTCLCNVIKATVFLQDMNDFKRFNGVYAEYFPENQPARSTIQVARIPLDSLIEIEVIVGLPEG